MGNKDIIIDNNLSQSDDDHGGITGQERQFKNKGPLIPIIKHQTKTDYLKLINQKS